MFEIIIGARSLGLFPVWSDFSYSFSTACRLPIPEPTITPTRDRSSFVYQVRHLRMLLLLPHTGKWFHSSCCLKIHSCLLPRKSFTSATVFTLYSGVEFGNLRFSFFDAAPELLYRISDQGVLLQVLSLLALLFIYLNLLYITIPSTCNTIIDNNIPHPLALKCNRIRHIFCFFEFSKRNLCVDASLSFRKYFIMSVDKSSCNCIDRDSSGYHFCSCCLVDSVSPVTLDAA